MEQKCLRDLDAPNAWQFLRAAEPEQTDELPWRPFRRIFWFNLWLFAVIILALFLLFEKAASAEASEILADLPYGLAISIGVAAVMATYATNLYRKSWNDRAKSLRNQGASASD